MFDNPRATLERLGLVKRKGQRERVEFDAPGWIRAYFRNYAPGFMLRSAEKTPRPRAKRYDQCQRAKAMRRRNRSARPRYKRSKTSAA